MKGRKKVEHPKSLPIVSTLATTIIVTLLLTSQEMVATSPSVVDISFHLASTPPMA